MWMLGTEQILVSCCRIFVQTMEWKPCVKSHLCIRTFVIILQVPDLNSSFLPGNRKRKGCSIRSGEDCSCSFCIIIRSNSYNKAKFCFWEWCDALLLFTSLGSVFCDIFYNILYDVGNLSRKISSASSLGSLEESHFLQASLDSSDSFSERRNPGELSMSPYYMKSMTPSSFEAALRQKEGELASYMSRLVWIAFILWLNIWHCTFQFIALLFLVIENLS